LKYKNIKQLKRFLEKNPNELKQLQEKYNWTNTIQELVFTIKNNINTKPICEYKQCTLCKSFSKYNKNGYADGCLIHAKKVTFLKKYGVENPFILKSIQEKLKKTNIEKYGVDNPMKNKSIQEKLKKTNIEKYGVEYIGASSIVQSKKVKSMQERYGVSFPLQYTQFNIKSMNTLNTHYGVNNPMQSLDIQQKTKSTIITKYGVDSINKIKNIDFWKNLNLDVLKEQMEEYTITYLAQKYNVFPSTLYTLAKKYNFQTVSLYTNEIIVQQLLEENKLNYKKNDRKILQGQELDYLIFALSFAIEINGNYWHSNISGKPDNYHLNKTDLCLNQNISLFHFFEDEFNQQQSLVINYIKRQIIPDTTKVNYLKPVGVSSVNKFISAYCLEKYMVHGNSSYMTFSLDSKKTIAVINYNIIEGTMFVYLVVTDTHYKLDYDSLITTIFQEIDKVQKLEVSFDRRFMDYESIQKSKLQLLRKKPPIKWDLDKNFTNRTYSDKIPIHYICDSGIAIYGVERCQL